MVCGRGRGRWTERKRLSGAVGREGFISRHSGADGRTGGELRLQMVGEAASYYTCTLPRSVRTSKYAGRVLVGSVRAPGSRSSAQSEIGWVVYFVKVHWTVRPRR